MYMKSKRSKRIYIYTTKIYFLDGNFPGFWKGQVTDEDGSAKGERVHILCSCCIHLSRLRQCCTCCFCLTRGLTNMFRKREKGEEKKRKNELTSTTGTPINLRSFLHSSLCSFVTLTDLLANFNASSAFDSPGRASLASSNPASASLLRAARLASCKIIRLKKEKWGG